MEQYIPKSVVLTKIDSMLRLVEHTSHCDEASFNSGRWKALTSIKNFIDTLEVKEVDIDKEINEHAEYMPQSEFSHDCEVLENIEWAKNEFRYFFELGMSVSKK